MYIDNRPFLRLGKYFWLFTLLAALAWPNPCQAGASIADGPRIGAIAERLAHADPAVRAEAAGQLAPYGQSAMPFLVGIREYGSSAQRRGAVYGMSLLPMPGLATGELVAALGDQDVTTRSLAAHALALVGPGAAPRLVEALASQDAPVRGGAAYALKLMGARAVPALIRGLESDDLFIQSHAAWLLGQMGDQAMAGVPALIRTLDAEDIRAMHVAAEAIDLIGPDPALVHHHLILLGSRSGTFPLHRIGAAAAPTLVRLLTRPGTPLAQLAFRALASIGQEAAPALRDALNTGTPSQRTAAALLLSDIDPTIIHTLPEDLRSSLAGANRKPEE